MNLFNMRVRCIQKTWFCDIRKKEITADLTIGDEYIVTNEISFDGVNYIELESTDSGEPFFEFPDHLFEMIRSKGEVAPQDNCDK